MTKTKWLFVFTPKNEHLQKLYAYKIFLPIISTRKEFLKHNSYKNIIIHCHLFLRIIMLIQTDYGKS